MAIYRANATRLGALVAGDGGPDWHGPLAGALDRLPRGARVCVMIHGFRYTWRAIGGDCFCPHRRLFLDRPVAPEGRLRPDRAAWPAALGFAGRAEDAGLCIGFGWEARAPVIGGFARVYRRAAVAGAALARLLATLSDRRPDLGIDMLTHSLGARVALGAAAARPDLPLGRMVFLGAAERVGPARAAMARLAAARSGAKVYHILSRANDAYDALFGLLAPGAARAGHPLGVAGLGRGRADWIDIQLDHPQVAAWLGARGMALARLDEPVSHWHFYADPGAMAFYRAILSRDPAFGLDALRTAGLPDGLEPRWIRMLPPVAAGLRMPAAPGPAPITQG